MQEETRTQNPRVKPYSLRTNYSGRVEAIQDSQEKNTIRIGSTISIRTLFLG